MRTLSTVLILLLLSVPAFADKATQELKVDLANSSLQWTGKKVAGAHNGTVGLSEGTVSFTEDILTAGRFVIDLNTINNLDLASDPKYKAKLESHLKSQDFFHVDEFPQAIFEITSAKRTSSDANGDRYEITGNLTTRGLTNPVTFGAIIKEIEGKKVASAKVVMDRVKWGLKYNSGKFFSLTKLGDKLIYDEFEVELDLKTL